ncbi:hypothetical protein chiPu_0019718 [Chiloscyllium punctatum]|uniref:C2H2-type domain-containing protein n=1 Tax=Chiloscyllium punctatum TaxID=137246 RepID=A0A401RT10_CHIPU|nr:hypothetical protein [Chiloscyllium punctatum]
MVRTASGLPPDLDRGRERRRGVREPGIGARPAPGRSRRGDTGQVRRREPGVCLPGVRQGIHPDVQPAAAPDGAHRRPDCGRCYRTSRDLVSRRLAHTVERPFKCPDCGQCYKTSRDLVS